jgi:single-strand DNA-binding protein
MNRVTLSGRFTKEHDLKPFGDGKFVLKNSLAVNEGYGDKQKSHYFNVVAFGKTAELIANYTIKGSKILLSGSLQNNNYDKNGTMVYTDQIIIDEVEFLDQKKKENEAGIGSTVSIDDLWK